MASGQTQYYGLSQWEAVDKVERVDFNSDNAKIDAALAAMSEEVSGKAEVSPWRSRRRCCAGRGGEAEDGHVGDLLNKGEGVLLCAQRHHQRIATSRKTKSRATVTTTYTRAGLR